MNPILVTHSYNTHMYLIAYTVPRPRDCAPDYNYTTVFPQLILTSVKRPPPYILRPLFASDAEVVAIDRLLIIVYTLCLPTQVLDEKCGMDCAKFDNRW